MLPKSHRLARPDFLQTKKLGKSFSTPHFSATVYSPPLRLRGGVGEGDTRFAIVTSTKLSKSAVIRNHLRRQIYLSLNPTPYPLNADIIFFPRPSMLKFTHAEIGVVVNSFLSKIPELLAGK